MALLMFNAIQTTANVLVPRMVQDSLRSAYRYLFSPDQITIVVDEHEQSVSSEDCVSRSIAITQNQQTRNQIFDAAMVYLPTKIIPDTRRFKVSKTLTQRSLKIGIETDVEVVDRFDNNVVLKWKLSKSPQTQTGGFGTLGWHNRFFTLSFNKKYKDRVLDGEDGYLMFVMKKSREIVNNIEKPEKVVKIHEGSRGNVGGPGNVGGSVTLNHPITFDKLAMDPELKKAIIDDLDRFLRRQEYYKKVGKAWKRGYFLYGPPGTGKSSLIAAMANYLKYDVYNLQLTSFSSDYDLRRTFVSTPDQSIIVIEDIDCNVEMQVRQTGLEKPHRKLTLSGLLNSIDGLWSSCGDERIIVFTTNHKDRLDPTLLRPGRMDMEIHMSYCTGQGFRFLASNYLNIHGEHMLFGEIEDLIAKVEVTPAEVSEQLMRSEDADIALTGVVNFLKRKMEANEIEEDKANGPEVREPKRLKIEEDKANGPEVREPKRLKILQEGLSDSEEEETYFG